MPFMFRSALLLLVAVIGPAAAADIQLPAPQIEGGKPLMQALSQRRSVREFSTEKLPPQVLSNLLWAAFGINRPDGHRTAPSAMNWQEIDIYVALPEGVYVYEPKNNRLRQIAAEDMRAATGSQPFVRDAPVNLVYVADLSKTGRAGPDDQKLYTSADAGFIGQNVYLFCASEGLGTVVRGTVNREALAKAWNLRPEQKVILAQTVGYLRK